MDSQFRHMTKLDKGGLIILTPPLNANLDNLWALAGPYEVVDILLCDSLAISEAISEYGSQAFALNSPSASLPLITCSSSHRTSKEEDFLHPPRHLLLTLGAVLTTHGLMFMDATYQFLECSSHSLNSQEPFLTFQLTSVALHGSSLHRQLSIFLI